MKSNNQFFLISPRPIKHVVKQVNYQSLWEIQSETFTSLIEFVKNHLVKIESLCHYQKPYFRYHNGSKILKNANRIVKYLSNKDDLQTNIFITDKTIKAPSNPIHQHFKTNDY